MSWTPQMEDAYQALSVIHSGRSSVVKKARHRGTQQLVAVKTFKLEKEGHAELNVLRLLCNHPNVTSFREVFQGEHSLHIVTNYYSASLPVYIKAQRKNLSRQDIKSIATQLLEGLAFMHENQVCYLAMHPNNVMLQRTMDGSFQVKLVHFKRAVMLQMDQQGNSVQEQMRAMLSYHGLAPAAQPQVGLAPGGGARGLKRQDSLQHSHANYSTPEMLSNCKYDAPEVLVGTQYRTASDVWSFGCLLAEMVLGEPLFEGESPSEVVHAIFSQVGSPPPALFEAMRDRVAFRSIVSQLPDQELGPSAFPLMERLMERLRDDVQLLKVLVSCLSMDPSQRPTAHQLLALMDVEHKGGTLVAGGSGSLKPLGGGACAPSQSDSGGVPTSNSKSSLPDLKFRMSLLSGAGGQLLPTSPSDNPPIPSLARQQSGTGLPPICDTTLSRLCERTSANGGLMMNRSSSLAPGSSGRPSLSGHMPGSGSMGPVELQEIRQEANIGRLHMSRYTSSDLPSAAGPALLSKQYQPQPPRAPSNGRSSCSGGLGLGINPLRTLSGGTTVPETPSTLIRTSSCGIRALSQDATMAMPFNTSAAGGCTSGGARAILKALNIQWGGGAEDAAPAEFAW